MNVDFAKFLALTAMMSAPLVAACDLSGLDDGDSGGGDATSTSDGGGGSDTAGDSADEGGDDGEGSGSGDVGESSADGSSGGADSSGGGGTFEGDCCDANGSPGCDDPDITDCVCAIDEVCCMDEIGWDVTCVDIASTMCEAGCPQPACCDAVEFPGCEEDPAIEACVCKIDGFCCGEMDGVWDSMCVQTANDNCDAGCPISE